MGGPAAGPMASYSKFLSLKDFSSMTQPVHAPEPAAALANSVADFEHNLASIRGDADVMRYIGSRRPEPVGEVQNVLNGILAHLLWP